MAKRVFICYRRGDTAAAAGRIYDRLWRLLSKPNVFFDVSTIAGGENFETKIASEIKRSDAVLIFVGQKWMHPNSDGQPRLWDSKDYVRAEVRASLAQAALVLPILVDGATMPKPELLPEDIQAIAAHNALSLRHESFDDDTEAIVGAIIGASAKERPWEYRSRPIVRIGYAAAGVVLSLIALVAVALLHSWVVEQPMSASLGDAMTTALLIVTPLAGAWIGWMYESRQRRADARSAMWL